jgi:peptidyl-prolyl cis-trans isomerase SurA
MFKPLLASFSLAFVASLCHAQSLPLVSLDSVVAVVEEDVILRSELDDALGNLRRQYQGREDQLPPQDVLERQLLERLIVGKLQVQRAEQTGVEATDTEVDQALTRMAAQNNMTVLQMRDVLAKDGVSLVEFRRSVRDELLAQKLRQRVVDSRAAVSETEVDIMLASDSIKTGEVRLAHLMVALPPNADASALEQAEAKINGIKKLIDEGKMDFQAAAIRYSDAPQALEGGDLGWRRFDQIPEAFADTIAGLQAGEVSQPIRAQSGLHLVKVQETRDSSQVVVTQYNARHIVIEANELVSEAEAEQQIRKLAEQLSGGADFAALARENSDESSTASLGGDMSWFEINSYGPAYAEQIAALDDNEVSAPFRAERGWHLVQRLGKREQDRTADFLRAQARDGIKRRKGDEAFEQFLRQIRSEAYVRTRLQTGAEDLEETEADAQPDAG